MKRIKIDGKVYVVNSEELRRYDGYLYKGQLLQHAPVGTDVVGYITEEDEHIGICKKSLRQFVPVLYGGIAVSALCVAAFGVFVFSKEYHVTPWTKTFVDGGNGTGELDDGMAKVDKKLSYSRYATYDGENVSLICDTSYSNAEVAVRFDGKTSDFYNMQDASLIPIQLSLSNEEVLEGALIVRRGNEVEEYPLAVERLVVAEKIQLAFGTDADREAGYQQMIDSTIEAGHYEEPVEATGNDGNLNISAYTDDGVNVDFANFTVITRKVSSDEQAGEIYNSEVDVLNQ